MKLISRQGGNHAEKLVTTVSNLTYKTKIEKDRGTGKDRTPLLQCGNALLQNAHKHPSYCSQTRLIQALHSRLKGVTVA